MKQKYLSNNKIIISPENEINLQKSPKIHVLSNDKTVKHIANSNSLNSFKKSADPYLIKHEVTTKKNIIVDKLKVILHCVKRLYSFNAITLMLLIIYLFYLQINLLHVQTSLNKTVILVENLEVQFKNSDKYIKSTKADFNYLFHLNRIVTKDINNKLKLLVKLNGLFVENSEKSINSAVGILRNWKRNDDQFYHVLKRRNNSNEIFKSFNETGILVNNNGSLNKEDEFVDNNNIAPQTNGLYRSFNIVSKRFVKDLNSSVASDNVTLNTQGTEDIEKLHRHKRETENISQAQNRGKHNGKSKKRGLQRHVNCNLFCCSTGPQVIHFKGARPESVIQDGGVIGPWYSDLEMSGDYIFKDYNLIEGRAKVNIKGKGLYMIYAQVYYLTTESYNSFSINIEGQNRSEKVIALCSTETNVIGLSEVSCYTSVTCQLLPGDAVFLVQRERRRRVLFRDGHTFLEIIALNNPPKC